MTEVVDAQWRLDIVVTDKDRAEIIDSLSRAVDKVVELLPPLRIAFGRHSQTSETAQRVVASLHRCGRRVEKLAQAQSRHDQIEAAHGTKRLEQAFHVVNRRRARFDEAVRLDLGEE